MTLVGALAGNSLGDPKRFGLDAAAAGGVHRVAVAEVEGTGTRRDRRRGSTRDDRARAGHPAGVARHRGGRGGVARGVVLAAAPDRGRGVTFWFAVLAASAVAFATKFAGYVVPPAALEQPRVKRLTGMLPVALLASLVVLQTFSTGRDLVLDARAAGCSCRSWPSSAGTVHRRRRAGGGDGRGSAGVGVGMNEEIATYYDEFAPHYVPAGGRSSTTDRSSPTSCCAPSRRSAGCSTSAAGRGS